MHSFCWQVLELEFNYANNFSHSPSDCIKCISTLIFQSFLIDNKLCAEELGHPRHSFLGEFCSMVVPLIFNTSTTVLIENQYPRFSMNISNVRRSQIDSWDPFFVDKFKQFYLHRSCWNVWWSSKYLIYLSPRFAGKVLLIPILNFSRQICPRQVSPALISIFK